MQLQSNIVCDKKHINEMHARMGNMTCKKAADWLPFLGRLSYENVNQLPIELLRLNKYYERDISFRDELSI